MTPPALPIRPLRPCRWMAACRLPVLGLCALAAAWPGGEARADGIILDAYSAVSAGRGGTNIAHSDNGAILFENPASMVHIPSRNLVDFTGGIFVGDYHYTESPNGGPGDDTNGRFHLPENPSAVPHLSAIHRADDGRWAVGAGAFFTAGYGTDWMLNTSFAGSQEYRSFGAVLRLIPAAAVRLTDRLSLGATAGLAIGHTQFEGPTYFNSGPLAGTPALTDLSATGIGPAWSVGLHYRLSERTSLGLVYTGESRLGLEGDLDADVYTPAGVLSSSFDAELDLVMPQRVGFGARHQLDDRNTVSFDVIWFDWSRAFDRFDFTFSNASNPLLAGPPVQESVPLEWRDTVSFKLGYEHQFPDDKNLRLGYIYHRSPAPDDTLTPYLPAILEHGLTVGYGCRLGNLKLDLSYIFGFAPDRDVRDSQLAGNDFDNSSFESMFHVLYTTVAFEF